MDLAPLVVGQAVAIGVLVLVILVLVVLLTAGVIPLWYRVYRTEQQGQDNKAILTKHTEDLDKVDILVTALVEWRESYNKR